jgi:hypothetical protein
MLAAFLIIPLLQAPAAAPPALPDTDIHLYELLIGRGDVELGAGHNLTRTPGYDNQPVFTVDGQALLFSARRDGVQNDIYRVDLASGTTRQLTATSRNEYSPRPADGGFTVLQEENGAIQEIWRFDAAGGLAQPVVQLPALIGYYAFATPRVVYAFILGEPSTLQRIDLDNDTRRTIASDIGRCLQTLSDGSVSYVRIEEKHPVLYRIDAAGASDTRLFPLLPDTEGDYAWLPDGSGVLSTKGTALFYRTRQAAEWRQFADLKDIGVLSRLAVSPDGRRLAVVALRP